MDRRRERKCRSAGRNSFDRLIRSSVCPSVYSLAFVPRRLIELVSIPPCILPSIIPGSPPGAGYIAREKLTRAPRKSFDSAA